MEAANFENLKISLENIQQQINLLREYQVQALQENITRPEGDDSLFNSGDTSWLLISTTLVLGMTLPGIMLYYAGMVRLQNALSTAMQGYALAALITFLWMCFGYSLSFAPAALLAPSLGCSVTITRKGSPPSMES
jgi:hypothetical protein